MTLEKKAITQERRQLETLAKGCLEAGDFQELRRLSSLLEELQNLEIAYDSIITKLAKQNLRTRNSSDNKQNLLSMRDSKRKAKAARETLLGDLRQLGLDLGEESGAVYSIPNSRKLLGTAYATRIANKWFLGLPDEDYKCIVFLCDQNEESILRFFVGEEFIDAFRDRFSYSIPRDKKQFKFNIYKRNSRYTLRLTDGFEVDLTPYIEDTSQVLS